MLKHRGRGKRGVCKSGPGFLVEQLESRTLLTTLPVLTINGTSGNDYISLAGSGGSLLQVDVNSTITDYNPFDYSAVSINGVGGNDTINILSTELPTTVVGAGQDTVMVGDTNGVQDVTSPVTITDPPSSDYADLTIDDSADKVGRTASISESAVTNLAPAAINYHAADLRSLTINGGTGGNTLTVTDTPGGLGTTPTTLNSGTGGDHVNIQGTTSNTVLYLQGQSGNDTVSITNAGSTQGIHGAINIENDGSFDALTIDDSADTTARTATFSTFTPGGDTAWESITGLAPASIDYEGEDISSATFDGGNGGTVGNTFNIFGIAPGLMSNEPINLNTGNDTYNVVNIATTAANTILNVLGQSAHDNVYLTNAGSVQGILGTVNIATVQTYSGFLFVDDSADATARTVALGTFTPMGDTEWESITGLAPGTINYKLAQAGSFTIDGGSGGNTFNINGLGHVLDSTDLNTGTGADQVNIHATDSGSGLDIDGQNGLDTVNITNAGSPQGVQGAIYISNDNYFDQVTVDDSADSSPESALLSTIALGGTYGYVSFSSSFIAYKEANVVSPITIKGGSGGNTFTVQGLVLTTDLYTGAGSDHVNIQDTPSGSVLNVDGQFGNDTVSVTDSGSVQGIQGTVNIENTGAYDTLTIDDSADAMARNATLSTFTPSNDSAWESLAGLAPATINYELDDITSAVINGGSGGNTFNINSTAAGSGNNLTVNTGTGSDVINVHPLATVTILSLNGQGGSDTINLDFTSGNPLPNVVNLSGTFTVTGFKGGETLNNTTLNIARSTIFFSYVNPPSDPLALIRAYLLRGYNAGTWNGTATSTTSSINSLPAAQNPLQTTAIGYADSADGLIVGQPANTIELKYTLYGDTTLTGTVGFNDFTRLTQHYNQTSGGTWDTGDFNYDGSVNFADFTLMTRTYNTSIGSQASPAIAAVGAAASAPSIALPQPTAVQQTSTANESAAPPVVLVKPSPVVHRANPPKKRHR